jgi:hypothetical protein
MQKRQAFSLPFHRISRSKRVVAPQHCLVYATSKVSSEIQAVIPFTLNYLHFRFLQCRDKQFCDTQKCS